MSHRTRAAAAAAAAAVIVRGPGSLTTPRRRGVRKHGFVARWTAGSGCAAVGLGRKSRRGTDASHRVACGGDFAGSAAEATLHGSYYHGIGSHPSLGEFGRRPSVKRRRISRIAASVHSVLASPLGHTPARPHVELPSTWVLASAATLVGLVIPVIMVFLVTRLVRQRSVPSTSGNRKRSQYEPEKAGLSSVCAVLRRLLRKGPHRRRSMCMMLLLLASLGVTNFAVVAQSYAERDYMSALADKDTALFALGLAKAFILLVLATPARTLEEFATGGLGIAWRDCLTYSFLAEFFQPHAVHWLRSHEEQVQDPDMRIAVEAGHFSDAAVLMVRDVLENSVKFLSFVGIVFTISPPLCAIMVAYAVTGAVATILAFGKPLVALDRDIRAKEASFRGLLARCRDRAEALALSAGEASEGIAAQQRYDKLRRRQWSRVGWRTGLASFRDYFNWAARLLPIAVVAPLWLSGDIPFGALSQSVSAFGHTLTALTVLIRKFRSVASLVAEGGRLEGLADSLARSQTTRSRPHLQIEGHGARLESVSLELPSGAPLCQNLTFTLKPCDWLLVLGDSGVGKTTLVRALAGLWGNGHGRVMRTASTLFLAQEPYIPDGTLRRVLTFPAPEDAFSESAITNAAVDAHLGGVLKRYSLDQVTDWEAVLSRGEQQRCAFCRLLLFQPELAVLDEATSALDEETEMALYRSLKTPCVITVSHRHRLRDVHTHVLARRGEHDRGIGQNAWEFSSTKELPEQQM